MSRPWQIWLTFATCLIVAVAAVGWLSVKALQTDLARAEARHEAAVEENARLALWRMDSFMTSIVAQENARPWSLYDSTKGQKLSTKGGVEIPAPVAPSSQAASYVVLHFQFAPESPLTSFEVSQNSPGEKSSSANSAAEQPDRNLAAIIADLQNSLDLKQLVAQLPKVEEPTRLADSTHPNREPQAITEETDSAHSRQTLEQALKDKKNEIATLRDAFLTLQEPKRSPDLQFPIYHVPSPLDREKASITPQMEETRNELTNVDKKLAILNYQKENSSGTSEDLINLYLSRDEQVKEFTKQIEEIQSKLNKENQHSQLTDHDPKASDYKSKLSSLQSRLDQRLQELRPQIIKSIKSDLEAATAESAWDRNALESSQTALQEKLEDLKKKLDAVNQKIIAEEYDNTDPGNRVASLEGLREQIHEAEKARDDLQSQLDQLNAGPQAANASLMPQSQRSQNEYQARSKSVAQSNTSAQILGINNDPANSVVPQQGPPAVKPTGEVVTSMMKPVWMAGKLLLVRRVMVGGREYGQGCLLDWPAIKTALLAEVNDLLSQAELQPVVNITEDSESHRLASLPVMLIPGGLADVNSPGLSPIKQSLLIAWGALGLVALAGVVLLRGVLALSERRAAFVSAVTHELRTPLTTFRMYAEMLSEDMVASKAERHQYLETLRIEADRLTHLVANVLAYARLERGRPGGRIETLTVDKLLIVATQRLTDRAAQAQFQLANECAGDVLACMARADPAAVEQILFNLVDNACKYAASATDRTLHLSATHDGRQVKIRLCDHGPGITSSEQRRLFQAFRKSAQEAAHSAPGVGLGLALSRRLAQDMRGDLCYESTTTGGACFVLSLPTGD